MLEELDHAFHQLVLLHVAAADLLHREPKSPLGIVDDVGVEQIAAALDLVLMSHDVSDAAVDFEDLVYTREIGMGFLDVPNVLAEALPFLSKHGANGFGDGRLAHIGRHGTAHAGKVGRGKSRRQGELAHRRRISHTCVHLGAHQQVSVGNRAAHWPKHAPGDETRYKIWTGYRANRWPEPNDAAISRRRPQRTRVVGACCERHLAQSECCGRAPRGPAYCQLWIEGEPTHRHRLAQACRPSACFY